MMRKKITALILAAAALVLAAPPVDAARKPRPAALAVTATPSIVAPTSVAAGEVYELSGTGFDPALPVVVRLIDAERNVVVSGGLPDADGNVGPIHDVDWTAGDTTVTFYTDTEYALTEVASTTVTVTP